MLSKMQISYKIYLMGAIQLLLVLAIGWVGISQMNKIGKEIVEIAEEDIPLTKALTLMTEHQLEQAIYFENALFKGTLMSQGFPGAEESFKKARKNTVNLTKKVHQEIIDTENFIQDVIPLLHSQKAIDKFNQFYDQLKSVEKDYEKLETEVVVVLDLVEKGSIKESIDRIAGVEALEEKLDTTLIAMLNDVQQFTLDASIQA